MAGPLNLFVDRRCRHRYCVGKPGAYRMTGHCLNCGTAGILGLFTAGHEHGYDGPCPACGCDRVHWDRLATATQAAKAAAS